MRKRHILVVRDTRFRTDSANLIVVLTAVVTTPTGITRGTTTGAIIIVTTGNASAAEPQLRQKKTPGHCPGFLQRLCWALPEFVVDPAADDVVGEMRVRKGLSAGYRSNCRYEGV
jgi:hypothetical protein